MSHIVIGMEKLRFVNFTRLLNCKRVKKWQKVKEGHANIQIANLQLRVTRHYHAGRKKESNQNKESKKHTHGTILIT